MNKLDQETYNAIHDAVERDWKRFHVAKKIRCKVAKNGQRMYRRQCLKCGTIVETLKESSVPGLLRTHPEPFDDELHLKWARDKYADFEKRRLQAENDQNAQWWAWYSKYLESQEWKEKRARVLARADGVCEGCMVAAAKQVHHLHYKRAGDELLFDLVAVCLACHQKAHPDKDISGDD